MKYKHNYIVNIKDISSLPTKLKRYTFIKENSQSVILYINSFIKDYKNITVVVWNRSENNKDIYEEYSFPLNNIASIEEISYKTTTYTPKGKIISES